MHGYEITTDPARIDVAAVHAELTRSYWSPGIPRDVVERGIAHSLRRFALATRDAHGLYARFGFAAAKRPEWHMFHDRAPEELWPR